MSFAVAAAGTGGHVFPGLAVGQALAEHGIPREDILFVGGDRLEARVYPESGFPFLSFQLRGLERRITARNLALPAVVWRAAAAMAADFRSRSVRAVLGMGGYVTIPAALAARRVGARLAVSEQNAEAGLASRFAGTLALRRFGSFPLTKGLPGAEWVGNPIRRALADFDRERLQPEAFERYRLEPGMPVVGVFGGSLGAGVLNGAVETMIRQWRGAPIQVVHLTGPSHAPSLAAAAAAAGLVWRVIGFEERMELFYAASDLVVARAGGAVAELTATGTPAILVPGRFGSAGHQEANARVLAGRGAAVVIDEFELDRLPATVSRVVTDRRRLDGMRQAAAALARPDAADVIAKALEDLHG